MTKTKETGGPSFKILVVDDNSDLSRIIQLSLEIRGYQVRTARDGDDGYRTYLTFQPDLVITDIQMPNKDGLELIKSIRTHNPFVRAIYMTGAMEQFEPCLEREKRQYQAGFLEKPFSRGQLINLVLENIQNAQRNPVRLLNDDVERVCLQPPGA